MAKQQMSQFAAILALLEQSGQKRNSRASHKRLLKACKALGLTDEQTRTLESIFEYRMGVDGDLYPYLMDDK
jgi:hypothetical protein